MAELDNSELERRLFGAPEVFEAAAKKKKSTKKKEGGNKKKRSAPEARAAWEDSDDKTVRIRLLAKEKKTNKKLRKQEQEREVSGVEYQERLKEEFSKLHGNSSWAKISDEVEEDRNFLRSTGKLTQAHSSRLLPHVIQIQRLVDANKQDPNRAVVKKMQFHPRANVMFTAGMDKTLRLFQIDGKTNPKIQGVHFEDLPITSAVFTPSGEEIIVSGNRPFMYIYDVERGSIAKVQQIIGRVDRNLRSIVMSPDGATMAAQGTFDGISLISGKTKQRIAELCSGDGAAKALAYTSDSKTIFSVAGSGFVSEWDVGMRRCVRRFRDAALFQPCALALSPTTQFLAIGSGSGIVSVYDMSRAETESEDIGSAIALHPAANIMSLTTAVSELAFSPSDGQVLAIASNKKQDALRLVHVPSFTVFSNWPPSKLSLEYVSATAFSPNSGMFAVGNARGKALLFRLKHYMDL